MRSITRQSKQMQLLGFLASLAWAIGARISVRSFNDATSRIGPDTETWHPGVQYACIQKWEESGKYVDKFCLVDLAKARLFARRHLKFALTLDECASKDTGSHLMRVCSTKGKPPNRRLSWKSRNYVPKACFRYSHGEEAYPVIEGAVTEQGCKFVIKSYSIGDQGKFGEAIARFASTTTAPNSNCICKDGFIREMVGEQCKCRPAPCDVVGTINDGLECECIAGLNGDITWSGETARGVCVAEAKDLFSAGSKSIWEHKGKEFKCCVSSVGGPTQLQDMTVSPLPSKGQFGRKDPTGCGYMFGDHYHNGMNPYTGWQSKRHYATCPVPVAKLIEASGENFDVVKKLLMLED